MNTKELTEKMESLVPNFVSTTTWADRKYVEYVSFSLGNPSHDPDVVGMIYKILPLKSTEEDLCLWHWEIFNKMLQEIKLKTPCLFWRIKPEYSEWETDGIKKAKIYARYIIEDIDAPKLPPPAGLENG